jgi:ABC-2 type transport system ATP-binding protein
MTLTQSRRQTILIRQRICKTYTRFKAVSRVLLWKGEWGPRGMELRIENLSKTYANGVKALDSVSLAIPAGMYGLLGPNGAGKSTLMRTLATLQEPDSGSARLGDIDVLGQKDKVRSQLGYLPQEFGVYPRTSAQDMLGYIALLKGLTNARERKDAVESMLKRCNLYDHRKKALTSFSGGMRQRFGIAQALIGNPQLLIVDEPTAGLDPGERNRFYNLLAEVGEQVIVILSTHIVEDVMDLCTKMAIIHKGQVLYQGHPQDAIAQLNGRIWQCSIAKSELAEYERCYQVVSAKLVGGRRRLHIYSASPLLESFAPSVPDLEDFFFVKLRSWN